MKNVILIHGYNGIPKIYKYFEEKLKERDYNVIAPIAIEDNEQTKCKELISKCYFIYSNNDHIVPFETLEKFLKLNRSERCFNRKNRTYG